MLWMCPPSRFMRASVPASSQQPTVSSCGRVSARPGLEPETWRDKDAGFVFDFRVESLHIGPVKLKGLSRLEPQQPS